MGSGNPYIERSAVIDHHLHNGIISKCPITRKLFIIEKSDITQVTPDFSVLDSVVARLSSSIFAMEDFTLCGMVKGILFYFSNSIFFC